MSRLINCNTLGSSDGLIAIDLINCNTLGSSDGLIAIDLARPMVILDSSDGHILEGSSNRRMDGSFD
jgi:hypothetical protein